MVSAIETYTRGADARAPTLGLDGFLQVDRPGCRPLHAEVTAGNGTVRV